MCFKWLFLIIEINYSFNKLIYLIIFEIDNDNNVLIWFVMLMKFGRKDCYFLEF